MHAKKPRYESLLQSIAMLAMIVLVSSCTMPAMPESTGSEITLPEIPIAEMSDPLQSTSPITATGSIPAQSGPGTTSVVVPGNKSSALPLSNADSATNQLFSSWLVTTGVAIADLSPEVRAASPVVTVTLLLENEAAIDSVKAGLDELGGMILAEAGTMVSVRLFLGQLDRLAQLEGILLIQAPSVAPPLSHIRTFPRMDNEASADVANLFTSPQSLTGPLPQQSWTQADVNAWSKSVSLDWAELENLQTQKDNHLALADSAINNAYQIWRTSVMASSEDATQAAWGSQRISVTLVMQDKGAVMAAQAMLPALNAYAVDTYDAWLVVSIPVGQIDALMQLPGLVLAQQPAQAPAIEDVSSPAQSQRPQPAANTSDNTILTQGVSSSTINVWHQVGFRGKNVKVAIMDVFDQKIIDAAFAKGEIPTDTLEGPSTSGVGHGIAVAEIIHDMAPQATLSLHTIEDAADYCIAMANTLEALAKAGNQIISSSIGPTFCASAGNGDTNPMAQVARRVRYDYNTFYVQAAGNNAQHHHERRFDTVEIDNGIELHDFSGGDEITVNVLVQDLDGSTQPARVLAGQVLQFYLRWDGGWPRSAQDYDLYLVYYDGSMWRFLNCTLFPCLSENVQNGNQLPIERIETLAPFTGYYGLIIVKFRADGDHLMDLLTSHAQPHLNLFSEERSLIAAGSYEDVFAVGAVDVKTLNHESYSSEGPTYGPGNTADGGFSQPKLAGFANVDTFAYGNGAFNGTSSATPHVAGAAAVLKSAAPCLSARQMGTWLMQYATDRGAVGYDYEFGAGALHFPTISKRPSCVRSYIYMPRLEH